MTIRAVIADDEPPARRKLRRLLAREADVSIAGEASTGEETVALLRENQPDVLFLDVQMPGLDGFQVLEALGDLGETAVVFVTAYDDYAVRAFEVQALDYLLKPVAEDRLAAVMERLRAQLGRRPPGPESQRRFWKRILVQGPRLARFVQIVEIDWIEADRNYLVLHCGSQEHLVRATLEAFAERLDPNEFVRINRSTVVNLDRVRELQPWTHGEFRVILEGGRELTWSRRYLSSNLDRFLLRS
jgi:two-component system, LytTR family, response regulator